MTERFRSYHTASCRYKGYDYSLPGIYFITITTNKIPFFGSLRNGETVMTDCGDIAKKFWMELPDHFTNISLDEFVIMPDHVHGLVIITKSCPVDVETLHATSLHRSGSISRSGSMSKLSPGSGSLGVIIRSYKSAVTKAIHEFEPNFKWQSGYYDHIVRDLIGLETIRKYIRENPSREK